MVIGKLARELRKWEDWARRGRWEISSLTEMRAGRIVLSKPVDVAITNSGGLRKNSFAPGDLRGSFVPFCAKAHDPRNHTNECKTTRSRRHLSFVSIPTQVSHPVRTYLQNASTAARGDSATRTSSYISKYSETT